MLYRPEIDGLRAVAVVAVVLYHAGLGALPGGFAGVDVFFVISGFLITRIIAEEARDGCFSFLQFYERRARRLLPALFVVLAATIVLSWFVMVPYQMESFAESVVATLVFLSNVLFWLKADYFAVDAGFRPLLHTWSLAVEEQFYIFFPILLITLYRFGTRVVVYVLTLGTGASLAAAFVASGDAPTSSFFLIQFRAWELLVGALAALWIMHRQPKPNGLLSGLGLVFIAVSFVAVSHDSLWPGPMTLLPVLGSASVILFAGAQNAVGRLLAWEPVRFVGLISYSLYLWHLPLLTLLKIQYLGDTPIELVGLAVLLSGFAAWLSWRFIERPFRKAGIVRLPVFTAMMLAAALPLLAFGVSGWQSSGFHRFMIAQVPLENRALVLDREAEIDQRTPVWEAAYGSAAAPFADGETNERRILILGDSMSGDLYVTLTREPVLFPDAAFRRVALDDPCMSQLVSALNAASNERFSGSARCHGQAENVITSRMLAVADEIVLAANWEPETLEAGLLLALSLAESGHEVALLGIAKFNDMASLSMRLARTSAVPEHFIFQNLMRKYLLLNQRMREFAEKNPNIRYLDKLALYCDFEAAACDLIDETGRPMIFDNAHLTTRGIIIFSERVAAAGWF